MKAFVFSIGEPTTELCKWSLERQGLDVTVIQNENTSLWHKLKYLYNHVDEDFIRVDADIICNRNVLKLKPEDNCWWHTGFGWDWYSQDLKPISVHYIKKEAISYLRAYIDRFKDAERPESQMFRLEGFEKPRRCEVANIIAGIHGYKQNDTDRVKDTKTRRNQLDIYDFELMERMAEL